MEAKQRAESVPDDQDELLDAMLDALQRLPDDRQREIVFELIGDHDPRVIAAAVADVAEQWKARGMSDTEIRESLAEACAELGINRSRALH